MISKLDDYAIHQTPAYLRVPGTTDRNFYDRYWFAGYTIDGSLSFGVAYGRYPNRFIKDAHVTFMIDGIQHSLHLSDVDSGDPGEPHVGPYRLRVEDPMREIRVTVSDHPGLACDMRFSARSGSIDEGRVQADRAGVYYVDQTRFMQYGVWAGWVEIDGRRLEIDPTQCWGLRDKSWGIRQIAEQSAAEGGGGSLYWMNVVFNMDDTLMIARTSELRDGTVRERAGYAAPLYPNATLVPIGETNLRHMATWTYDLSFIPHTRQIQSARYSLQWSDGSVDEYEGESMGTFWYAGIGYEYDRWAHGLSHGGLAIEQERWPVNEIDLSLRQNQFTCHVLRFRRNGTVVGFGHTEQFFLGPHDPFGWDEQYATDNG